MRTGKANTRPNLRPALLRQQRDHGPARDEKPARPERKRAEKSEDRRRPR